LKPHHRNEEYPFLFLDKEKRGRREGGTPQRKDKSKKQQLLIRKRER